MGKTRACGEALRQLFEAGRIDGALVLGPVNALATWTRWLDRFRSWRDQGIQSTADYGALELWQVYQQGRDPVAFGSMPPRAFEPSAGSRSICENISSRSEPSPRNTRPANSSSTRTRRYTPTTTWALTSRSDSSGPSDAGAAQASVMATGSFRARCTEELTAP